ncbi:MAG: hypothetical protein OEW62_03695 [Candidatus Bathyarchaeota archaeon]|nr:hypothetical protein [Candidatus Bathyarchaeota archaeon]MDH5595744.1 hypothetical protein [Candidatus Bathyarchaeota archaeon]
MRCVFLDSDDECHAGLTYEEESRRKLWKPDDETKKAYCTMTSFMNCPRFRARAAKMSARSSRK